MQASNLGAVGFAAALTLYAALTLLLLGRWRHVEGSGALTIATVSTAVWAALWMNRYAGGLDAFLPVAAADWARAIAWLAVAVHCLRSVGHFSLAGLLRSAYGMIVILLCIVPAVWLALYPLESPYPQAWTAGGFALSLLALLGAEQTVRNAPGALRSSLVYLGVGIAGLFAYDLAAFSWQIASGDPAESMLAARGFIAAILLPPIVVSIQRRRGSFVEGRLPRKIVFYLFGAVVVGVYVAFILTGQLYVRSFGGGWGDVLAVVLISAAIAFAVVLSVSPSVRGRVRVFLMKTFFEYKYDYREEWLRFIRTLSESGLENVAETAVQAVAQIVNSPGGVIWVRDESGGDYQPVGAWRSEVPDIPRISRRSALVRFLRERQWVIDLGEMKQYPDRYAELDPGSWLTEDGNWWIIVPMFLGRELFGFVLLSRPNVAPSLNFEDHDLLKTVGRHIGMHINQAESDKRLAESRQFGAYNRLTAFLMHDLNNLVAQQSMVVKNAERFRDNPEFVDDAIDTIANSVAKMRRLMDQLSRGSKAPNTRRVDALEVVEAALQQCAGRKPAPALQSPGAGARFVEADPERLTNVFEHLIRNAQDATPGDGRIAVTASVNEDVLEVMIEDSGVGMSAEFVRERLFRPFDSTKGSGSMGIGAYQAREYVRSLGGQVDVTSRPGEGTRFTVRLPLSAAGASD